MSYLAPHNWEQDCYSQYGIQVSVQPTQEPLTLDEAKIHLRIDHDFEDALIASWVIASRQHCEMFCRKTFTNKTYLMVRDRFHNHDGSIIELPFPPVIAVTSITYIDTNGIQQTLDPSLYALDTVSEIPRLYPTYNNTTKSHNSWPHTQHIPNAVQITYTVGYSGAVAVPDTVKSAMKLLIGNWYQNRESSSPRMMTELPQGVEALLWGLRTF